VEEIVDVVIVVVVAFVVVVVVVVVVGCGGGVVDVVVAVVVEEVGVNFRRCVIASLLSSYLSERIPSFIAMPAQRRRRRRSLEFLLLGLSNGFLKHALNFRAV
jgi:hypothetical protein